MRAQAQALLVQAPPRPQALDTTFFVTVSVRRALTVEELFAQAEAVGAD